MTSKSFYSTLIPTCVDVENVLIRPGLPWPPVVCLTSAEPERPPEIFPSPEYQAEVARLLGPDRLVIAHNGPFDFWSLATWCPGAKPLILRGMREGRFLDTIMLQRLIEITTPQSRGGLALDAVGARYGVHFESKDDGTQLSYGPLLGQPLNAYREQQIRYPLRDSSGLLEMYLRMRERFPDVPLEAATWLTYRAFVFAGYAGRGPRTSEERTRYLEEKVDREINRLQAMAQQCIPLDDEEAATIEALELERAAARHPKEIKRLDRALDELRLVRSNGKGNIKRLQAFVKKAYDGRPPMTEAAKGRTAKSAFVPQIARGHDVLAESGDPFLEDFAKYGQYSKCKNADIVMLKNGWNWPIHTRYSVADTLRIISSKPNLMNLQVGSGVRECFRPREGHCFIDVDCSSLELCTVADIAAEFMGKPELANWINSGIDVLSMGARELHGCDYSEARRRYEEKAPNGWAYRQAAKVVIYGKLGGLSNPVKMQKYSKKYGMDEPVSFWRHASSAISRGIPTLDQYLGFTKRFPQCGKDRYVSPLYYFPGGIKRWGASYCAASNTPFQGVGAKVAGDISIAGFELQQDPAHVLSQCHVVLQVHDSWLWEVPLSLVQEAYWAIVELMTTAPSRSLKHVQMRCEAVATMQISKAAKVKWKDDAQRVPAIFGIDYGLEEC